MIIRGTTPYHSFILPIESSKIADLSIAYMQNEELLFEKTLRDVTISDVNTSTENGSVEPISEETEVYCQIDVHLTQEDTLKLKFYPTAIKNMLLIQIRLLTIDGEAYASEPMKERIYGVLRDGVLGEDSDG